MYITYLSHANSAKNNLEESFYNYLKQIDRTIIEDSKIGEFKKEILSEYDNLCKVHSRCKPIDKSFNKSYRDNGDFNLYGANAIFLLLKSK